VALEPDNPDYHYNLAQVYLVHWPQMMQIRKWTVRQLYDAAMSASEKAMKLAPKDFELAADYARNFFVAEQVELPPDWEGASKAWQHARTLVRNDDELFNTWLNEARVWYRANKEGKTVKCCEAALKLRPQSEAAKELMTMAHEPKKPKTEE